MYFRANERAASSRPLFSGIGEPPTAVATVPVEVLSAFAFDSHTLIPRHHQQLIALARQLLARPAGPPVPFVLIGHTDPVGTPDYNHNLGLQRASEVRRQLLATLDRMRPGSSRGISVAVDSRGATQLIPNNAAASRRVEIVGPHTSAPEAPACAHAIADAVGIEREAARGTLIKSANFANGFVRSVGALGARGRFIPTVLDNKYWFAKLYELITHYEIAGISTFRYPAFVLHFIPIFYDLYYDAFQRYSNGDFGRVSPLWMTHFRASGRPDVDSASSWLDGVKVSITTGVSAHVQGDMAVALERAYRSYVAKYCLSNVPFDQFRADFFETNRMIFERAKGALFLEMSRLGPFPVSMEVAQFVIGTGEAVVGGGLNIPEVYRWRCTAWENARRALGQAASPRDCTI
jgi:hypothetical protein